MPIVRKLLKAGEFTIGRIASVPFHPTLIIGLGGTGKEVLLRLRRKFFEKYGTPGLPVIAYLWIDTDLRDISLDGRKIDYISDEIRFLPTEMVDAQVPAEAFMNYFRNKNAYPNIFRWMDPAMEAHGAVVEGAKAFRPLGRLGFFHAFSGENGIERKLLNQSSYIQTEQARSKMHDIASVDSTKINVYIITSLAGGTGSGMFLDMAFLAKDQIRNANICGFIVLPSLFTNDTNDRRYANGYAALKELEFYSLRKDVLSRQSDSDTSGSSFHDFDVEWRLGNRKSIWGPPFNTCYLIDNSTNYGGSIMPEEKIEICDMIAESIFMDFSPDTDVFASQKRAVRENLAPALLNDLEYEYRDSSGKVIHTEIMSYRFSTFGWSKIYIPIDRIINACTYKLSEDIVGFWLKRNQPLGDLKEEVRRSLIPRIGIAMRDVLTSDIFSNLSKVNDVGDSVTKVISQWVASQEEKCLERVKSKTPNLRKLISDEYENFLRQQLSIGGIDSMGDFVKRIRNVNRESLIKNIENNIWNEINRMVGSPNVRIDLTIKSLTALCELLDEQIKMFNDDYRRAEAQANRWSEKVERNLQIISESENDKIFRKLTLSTYVRHTFNAIRSYLNARARMLIDETATKVCQEIQRLIGYESEVRTDDGKVKVERYGIILELRQFEEFLNILRERIHEKFESFDSPERSVIHINLYEKGDFESFYMIKNRKVDEELLAELDSEFFSSMSDIGSLIGLKDMMRSPGIEYIEDRLSSFCREKFSSLRTQSESDAVKTFMRRNTDEKRRLQLVEKFYSMGSGWLRKGTHFMGDDAVTDESSSMAYLGMADKRDDEYNQFLQLFRRFNATAERLNVDPSLVCFYTERAGIPLMYINGLDKYRQSYIEQSKKPGSGLHIDRFSEKYTDIMLKSESEINALRDAIRVLLTGSILGVINTFIDQDKRICYEYQRKDGILQPLGPEFMAIEMMRSNDSFRAEIERKVVDITNGFDREKLIQYYTILDYYTRELFRPTFYLLGSTYEEKQSHEYRAIMPVKEQIEKTLLASMSPEELETERKRCAENVDSFSISIAERRVFKR